MPRFLLERLAAGPIDTPERHPVLGAWLLSDIAAFTAHVEELAGRGTDGLEQVIEDFNRYFASVTSVVHRYGGDILTIAGDSFLCCWLTEDEGGIPAATVRAARAALSLQEAVTHPRVALPTRVGLAAGKATIGLVGGVRGRWELIPSGPAVADVLACEKDGPAGSVLVSAGALDALGATARCEPETDGRARLVSLQGTGGAIAEGLLADVPVIDPARLTPFVPAPVLRWGAADEAWLADFRHVTGVMTALAGPDEPSESEFARQNAAVVALQETAARFDGACKVQVDSKGTACSAIFGLPPRAHHDDVDRGLRAAAEFQAALCDLGFSCGTGVSSGRICCGIFGTTERREYALFGDAVNVASRLSSVAIREVLIDEPTIEAAALSLEVERRPVLALKNRAEPVRGQRLISLRPAPVPKRTLIGRRRERELVERAIERLRGDGRGATMLIEGEQGIGKSTLAASATQRAAEAGVQVFTVLAEPVERGTAYHPWRPVFAALLSDAGDEAGLVAAVGGDAQRRPLLPLLNPFLTEPLPETPATAALTGDARADRLVELLRDVVRGRTERQPGVLLVEDVQWLDSKSWSLLLELIRAVPRLLTIITERTGGGDETTEERELLRAHPDVERIALGTLSPEDTATLVRQRLRTEEISPAVLSLVLERVSGHPFFAEALLETLIESGAIRVTGQGAQLADHPELSIPVSIQSALLNRLDRLEVTQQLALKAAAVVGRTCSVAEVAAAHPRSRPETVQDQLAVLESLDLLSAETSGAGTGTHVTYAFRHQIVQDVAYGLLTGVQRRQMHRAVASFYENESAETRPGPELLAHHWLRADLPERAAPYLEEAGRRALHHGAFKEAVQLLEQAIAAAPHTAAERRALQEKALAEAHYFLGDMSRSRALLEQALERLGHPMRRGRIDLTRGLLAGIGQQARHSTLPWHRGTATSVDRETLLPAVEIVRKLVQISYLHATSTLELSYLVIAGLNLGELAGPSAELAEALANASVLAELSGLHRRADTYAERAIRMAEEHEHAPAGAYVSNVVAILYAGRGAWETALAHNDRALELFEPVGNYNLESELWQTRSALQLCRGALSPAERAWTRTRELATRTGSPVSLCWSWLDEAQTELARGNTEKGARALEAALAIPIVDSDGGTVIERHATAALARFDQGRHAEAVREADAVLDMLASRLPTGWVWGEFGALAVDVLLELRTMPGSDVPAAGLDRRIRRGLFALRRLAMTFGGIRVRVLVLRAGAAHIAGNERGAARCLRTAEALAARSAEPIDRARVGILRAELCSDRGRRSELLNEPLAILEGLGQERAQRRAEALLR